MKLTPETIRKLSNSIQCTEDDVRKMEERLKRHEERCEKEYRDSYPSQEFLRKTYTI